MTKIYDHKINKLKYFKNLSIREIDLPDVNIIEECAFQKCLNLEYVLFGNKLEFIGLGAFCFCTRLNKIKIPKSVKIIQPYAFEACVNLNNVEIPAIFKNSISNIFVNCKNLKNIFYV